MTTAVKLIPGLPRRELVEKIHFHHRQGEVAERALGFYLLDLQRRRLYKPGYRSAAHWALERLGLKRADKLIRLAERMEILPVIDGAFFRGEVPWTKVREIARVAVRETEEEWLELARSKTSRELEDALLGVKRGGLPEDGLGIPRSFQVVRIPLLAEDHACWEAAVRKLRRELGKGSTPRDALMAMVDMVLRTDPEGRIPGRRERGEPCYTVVYHGGADGKSAWIDTERGRVAVDPESLREKVRAGAPAIEATDVSRAGDVAGPGICRAIRFGERGSVPEEERDGDIPPEMKAAVRARDGYRCVICRSDQDVTVHHLDSRADGGKADMARLLSLCERCHSGGHEQVMFLRIEEDGRVTPLDAEGKEIRRQESAAEVLAEAGGDCPLVTIERAEAAGSTKALLATQVGGPLAAAQGGALPADPAAAPGPTVNPADTVALALCVDDLPAEITSAQWRELEGRLEWSPSHRAFLLRPEVGGPPGREEPLCAARAAPSPEGTKSARPTTFEDFVGQRRAVENLLLAARAAAARGEPLGHTLFSGPAGLGKTTLARLLAAECGNGIREVVAGHIADPHQLISLLARLQGGEFLFVDEIHGLGTACQEALYPALEDGRVDLLVRDRSRTRTIRVRLEPFTLVGASTRLGALSEPFRSRLRLKERLEPYRQDELAEIAVRAAATLGCPVSAEAARAIARRSRGTPREAIQLLERARDIAQVSFMTQVMADRNAKLAHVGQVDSSSPCAARGQIPRAENSHDKIVATYENAQTVTGREDRDAATPGAGLVSVAAPAQVVDASHVVQAARRAGIDKHGLAREERQIVRLLLRRRKPVGREAIASRLKLDLDALRDVHEPWLERCGLVERTTHGRVATRKAQAWYGRRKSKRPPGPTVDADEGEGPDGNIDQAGPNGGRRSIPILRPPFRFG